MIDPTINPQKMEVSILSIIPFSVLLCHVMLWVPLYLTTFLYLFSFPTHCYYLNFKLLHNCFLFLAYTLLCSQMYADKQSRGGILEPPGICEVKYRSQEQKIAMHRLDPTLIELDDLLVWLTPAPLPYPTPILFGVLPSHHQSPCPYCPI